MVNEKISEFFERLQMANQTAGAVKVDIPSVLTKKMSCLTFSLIPLLPIVWPVANRFR